MLTFRLNLEAALAGVKTGRLVRLPLLGSTSWNVVNRYNKKQSLRTSCETVSWAMSLNYIASLTTPWKGKCLCNQYSTPSFPSEENELLQASAQADRTLTFENATGFKRQFI